MRRSIRFIIVVVIAICIIALAYLTAWKIMAYYAEQNPNYSISEQAVVAFIRLLEEDKLPGISLSELDGPVKESGFDIAEQTTHFPVIRTMQLQKKDEPDFKYYYEISKADEQAPWVFLRTWMEHE